MTARDEFAHLLVIDRQLAGRWRRTVKARAVAVEVQPFRSLSRAEVRGVEAAGDAYGAFVGLAAATTMVRPPQ
jgi:hypothetical protein